MDVSGTMQLVTTYAIGIGFKIVGAIVFWLIGRWLIGLAIRMVTASLERQKVDPTLLRYLGTVISVTLNVILVVAILGYFGVETTSFAAIVAAAASPSAWRGAAYCRTSPPCSPCGPTATPIITGRFTSTPTK